MQSVQNQIGGMRGFITERDFCDAEREFPGITRFYYSCSRRPPTFLNLVVAFTASAHRSARHTSSLR